MLEALRDNPNTILNVEYSGLGDGIISGFEIRPVYGEMFHISPGIVKIDGEIYVSSEVITIEQLNESHYVYLIAQKVETSDGVEVVLNCQQSENLDSNCFELFRYTKNAEIFEFKNVEELISSNTPINRINQKSCKYGVIGGSIFHPRYFKLYAESVLRSNNATPIDIAFAFQCLNGIKNIDVVKQYFYGVNIDQDIFREMKEKLEKMSSTDIVKEETHEKTLRTYNLFVRSSL